MRRSHASRWALGACPLAVISLAVLGLAIPAAVMAQTVVQLAPFTSVTLRNGGHVVLRHGPAQRVTLLKGSSAYTKATIAAGDRLVIDSQGNCPRGYELTVEVVTPEVADIRVMDGGTIQTRGGFPRQAELEVAVGDGGMIDLRSMTVDYVAAAVKSGGRILTKPEKALIARISQGGAITYWGNPRVTSSVDHGGVVVKGAAADADKPLLELDPAPPAVPPVPPARARGTL
jgi:hypothetical protein